LTGRSQKYPLLLVVITYGFWFDSWALWVWSKHMKVDKSTVLFKLHFCAEYYILPQCVMVIWVGQHPYNQLGPGSDISWKLAVLTKVTFCWSIQTVAGKVCWTQVTSFFFHILCSSSLPFSIVSCELLTTINKPYVNVCHISHLPDWAWMPRMWSCPCLSPLVSILMASSAASILLLCQSSCRTRCDTSCRSDLMLSLFSCACTSIFVNLKNN